MQDKDGMWMQDKDGMRMRMQDFILRCTAFSGTVHVGHLAIHEFF